MGEFVTQPAVSLPATTGLGQYRFVKMNSTGKLAYPGAGAAVTGVTFAGNTTNSTSTGSLSVQIAGVALVEAAASTLAAGGFVTADANGRAVGVTTGHVIGQIVEGSSGAVSRILSILLHGGGSGSESTNL